MACLAALSLQLVALIFKMTVDAAQQQGSGEGAVPQAEGGASAALQQLRQDVPAVRACLELLAAVDAWACLRVPLLGPQQLYMLCCCFTTLQVGDACGMGACDNVHARAPSRCLPLASPSSYPGSPLATRPGLPALPA